MTTVPVIEKTREQFEDWMKNELFFSVVTVNFNYHF